ncbi:M14 family zinc carboxypeptidase [Acidicapsa dinghuensis]|uniref:M14 family zinc carboxypeptidase n=1 Tax=Acidicapsa dinghuensis TaxID=2218256 RepID=A0ABW1EL26_9BACT|nr:M14 metallopeptidase family protein [Acidicapsa dinghuensis]
MQIGNACRLFLVVSAAFAASALYVSAQVPTPISVLGHNPGDDYYLANYEEEIQYFHALAAHSDRIKMFTVGKTTEGRDIEIAVISSPENLAKLDEYKADTKRLSTAQGLNDASAKALAQQAKVIVHIDGGLHSSEVAGPQHSMVLAYKLLSAQGDPEIDRILSNEILLLYPTLNPDGQDMVVSWYRKNLGTRFEVSPMPWLFQDYVGHDNNRDGYMLNMKESQVVTKTELEYSPAIFYCQHQTAPFPARIWIPPFSDPISSNISQYVRSWFNVIGTDMTAYLNEHQMPGAISESQFDNWYPGFVDYAGSFRNEISFFTETALYRYATPRFYTVDEFPKDRQDLKALTMYTTPWQGGWWRLKDAVDYMVAGSMSVLDTAARYKETLLYNQYQAARDNIQHYQQSPPFAYVIPSVQRDVPEAAQLANIMLENGLTINETTAGFTANGREYPTGSWVILMNQPYSSLAQELFEIQRYPAAMDTGATKAVDLPYDVTGWTLPLQMGVQVDAVSDPITPAQLSALKQVTQIDSPAAKVDGTGTEFVLSHEANASFRVVNEVLANGGSVAFDNDEVKTPEGTETGALVVSGISRSTVTDLTSKYGASALALDKAPAHQTAIHKARVGLYRPWNASIDEGWTRWILEQYGYKPISLYNADMRSGGLKDRVDVLILPDMSARQLVNGFNTGIVPGEYAGGLNEEGLANVRDFVRQGGTLVAFNQTAATLIPLLSLPVKNVLEGVKSDKFFCSGALLRVDLESPERPATLGLPGEPTVMFENGPAFETQSGFKGAVLARYPKDTNPLESGLLLHPEAIEGKIAALEVPYGKGHIFLYGFKPQWRAQSHGTYKFFFNLLYKYEQPPYPAEKPAATVADKQKQPQ